MRICGAQPDTPLPTDPTAVAFRRWEFGIPFAMVAKVDETQDSSFERETEGTMRHFSLLLRNLALWISAAILLGGIAQAKSLVKVFIDSTPTRANIYVDGKDNGILGQTGAGDALKLPKGAHRLLLELDGYKSLEQTVNLSKGQHLTFKLQPEPSHLEIKPPGTNQNSLGGEIFVDGTQVGTVPAKLEVSVGKHTIEVRRPGYLVYTDQVDIKLGESRQLLVPLFAEPKAVAAPVPVAAAPLASAGSLMINAAVPAEVTVDTQLRGQAPVLVDNLTPGDHLVELQPSDKALLPWRRSVRVAAGQQGRVEVKFSAANEPGVPVSVVPRDTDVTYVVTLGQAQSCQTPCTLRAQPGRQYISVAGPGSKHFRHEITIPDSPAQITVQHLTLGKAIGAAVCLAYGLPSLIVSAQAANTRVSDGRTLEAVAFGSLAFTGATSAFSAIVTLATIKLNRASVDRMGQVSTLPKPRIRFLASGITPTPDRTGAMAGLSFAY